MADFFLSITWCNVRYFAISIACKSNSVTTNNSSLVLRISGRNRTRAVVLLTQQPSFRKRADLIDDHGESAGFRFSHLHRDGSGLSVTEIRLMRQAPFQTADTCANP